VQFIILLLISVLSVLGNYLAFPDPCDEETRISSIAIVTIIATVAPGRVSTHAKEFFEPLLRVIYEVSRQISVKEYPGEVSKSNLFEKCRECLRLCATKAPKEFLKLCSGLDEVKINPAFDGAVQNIFQSVRETCENK
jgi:hypothetical protein